MKLYLPIIFLLSLSICGHALRILTIIPYVTKSHYATGRRLNMELVKRGHQVVSITPYEEVNPPQNFTWVPVEIKNVLEALPHIKGDLKKELNFFGKQLRLWRVLQAYTEYITKLPKLKHFIETDNSHFDLVVAEEFLIPIFFVFAHKYNTPLVLFSTFGSAHYISEYMGNSLEISYVPHEFADPIYERNFFDRAKNLVFTIYDLIGRQLYIVNHQNELAKEVFKNVEGIPHLYDLERNAALILMNSHYSMSVVKPNLPNVVEIGGIHIEDVKPLKPDIKKILDDAKYGAILFSFGSIMELASQTDEFIENVLHALGKLKQKVLVKWNSDTKMPVTYNNIYPLKWLPQNDILAHPNVILFITHGGLLSSQEAIYHGVPTICLPFFGDQHINCMRGVQMGYALRIGLDLTTDSLHGCIERILTNQTFKDNAKKLSYIFKDRQNTAVDTAIYWIEYATRHKGMEFLKGPRRNLFWFQYCYIDLFACILMILYFLVKICQVMISFLRKRVKVKTS